MLPIHSILYPTDFSPQAGHAFQVACALARDYGARLVLLHVKPPEVVYGEGFVLPPDSEAVRRELLEQLGSLQLADPSVSVWRILEEGNPAAEILHTAAEVGCDLIVMGTHGRTGLGRLLMGSVAEAVLRKAPCPVLTIRSPFPAPPARERAASGPLVATNPEE
jgi:nucleotide-binding universal stress UspA family protein